ncbi:4Fe-4S single cluster domain-containing protein [Undibacterium sp. Ji50W]|uniref:4Fe-4S single cluster domain-containing protein n=1 Tax=Undibacterium sp. Ji50W TaxID=3413041 RepID=UPI003BF3A4FE
MKIAINKAHFPVTVLGPGRRIGIWLQGCGIGCKGCVSQDTWATDAGKEMSVASLLNWCREVSAGQVDGITISGGEPFDQPQALHALLDGLQQWRASTTQDFDILCYSGYPLATLQKKQAALLQKLDALIPEPFIDNKPLTQAWRGSSNQPLVLLSDRGRARMQAYVDAPIDEQDKRIQTMINGQRVWYVGIPARGDMQALEQRCAERGLKLDSVSWRP